MEVFLGLLATMFAISFFSKKSELDNYIEQNGRLNEIRSGLEYQRKSVEDLAKKEQEKIEIARNGLEYERTKMNDIRFKLLHDEKIIQTNIEIAEKKRKLIEEFLASKIKEYPIVSSVLADYMTAFDDLRAKQLESKKRPALKASEEVKRVKAEKRELISQNKAMKWELEYLKSIFPIIDEIEDDPVAEQESYVNPDYQHEDKAGFWLTPQEYAALLTSEKYQRALDRYMRRKKSNREIGLEYERYIGYLYEQDGYSVTYHGIEHGLENLGRDLICEKNGCVDIVQCKCWSKRKQIHENHINQLYGTTVMYKIQMGNTSEPESDEDILFRNMGKIVTPVFVSTTNLSETASEFARYLGIVVKIIPLAPYPIIKCNINQRTGERIYHLPFDQQYDRCIIDPKTGEFYARTVAEAEANGFRRAMRWHGNKERGE